MPDMPSWTETERLAALHRYDILDTTDDAAFQDFVEIAAHVCDAPIAVVNLIDAARQWFAAEVGLGVRETARDISICAQRLLERDVLVVPDLAADPCFSANPLVLGAPGLRFYGGAALETEDGFPLGTMCVLDTKPRPGGLTQAQADTLRALARQVMTQLELRRSLRLRAESEAAKDRLLQEKDLLMGEVHHRVKNSLSMVQSLLLLQARAAGAGVVQQQLTESAGRIRTIGAMHEHLYRFGAETEVDAGAYLAGLIQEQQAALGTTLPGRGVVFAGDGDPGSWPAHDAPTLGLVALELVTNALKYGAGTVRVSLDAVGPVAVLRVEDEGTGLAADFDPDSSRGFGMRLVSGLLRGRQGALRLDTARPGTSFVATLARPPS